MVESYQGLAIDVRGPIDDPSLRATGFWFNVSRRGEDQFRVHFQVSELFVRRGPYHVASHSDVALLLGRRWTHGLISLSRFVIGETYHVFRTSDWDPVFADDDFTDGDIRTELLRALQRIHRAQANTSEVLELDVHGVSDVLGISDDRTRGLLSEMITEGVAEPWGDTFGHAAENGACRITGDGLRELHSRSEREVVAEALLSIDDVDSFANVRTVTPDQAGVLLDKSGVIKVAEARVKEKLLQVLGDTFVYKDWGGERSDVFTTRVTLRGRRLPAAFLLKGPAVGDVLYTSSLGKRADQDLRLFNEPAELFVVQFVGKVDSGVYQRVRNQIELSAFRGRRIFVCVIDGMDTARLFVAYPDPAEVSEDSSS